MKLLMMRSAVPTLCVALFAAQHAHAAIDADEIKSLPGWDDGPLPSKQ
jgi:hypothetical protein